MHKALQLHGTINAIDLRSDARGLRHAATVPSQMLAGDAHPRARAVVLIEGLEMMDNGFPLGFAINDRVASVMNPLMRHMRKPRATIAAAPNHPRHRHEIVQEFAPHH